MIDEQKQTRYLAEYADFYDTAAKKRQEIKKLADCCPPAQRWRLLRQYRKPITRAEIKKAVALDKKIRGLNGY